MTCRQAGLLDKRSAGLIIQAGIWRKTLPLIADQKNWEY